MSESHRPQNENHILAVLPPEDYERLSQHLEPVEMRHSQILYEAGGQMEYVYFPSNSDDLLSLTTVGRVERRDRRHGLRRRGRRLYGVGRRMLAARDEGYINYRRGHITVLDRVGMEQFACECYRIVKDEFDSLVA